MGITSEHVPDSEAGSRFQQGTCASASSGGRTGEPQSGAKAASGSGVTLIAGEPVRSSPAPVGPGAEGNPAGLGTHSRARPARGPGQRRAPRAGQLQGSGQRVPGSAAGSSNRSRGSAGHRRPMAREPHCGSPAPGPVSHGQGRPLLSRAGPPSLPTAPQPLLCSTWTAASCPSPP